MGRLIVIFSCLLMVIPCKAEIITVDDDGIADFNTIQAAIDDANNGDIIEVRPGIYTGDGNRDIDFGGRAITVRSTNPNDPNIVASTIVDCNGTWLNKHRGFYFHNGEDNNSILNGLTIKNGYAWDEFDGNDVLEDGGGILIENSSPTISNCMFSGGSSDFGGGISCEDNSNPLIINCIIRNNSTSGYGAGIVCFNSSPTVLNCTIIGNSASDGAYGSGEGGGIGIEDSNPIIKNCVIVGNYASVSGGGIHSGANDNPSGLSVINCTIAHNHAGYNDYEHEGGGGIACYYTNTNLTNSIIWGNTAVSSGSQIALFLNPSWPSTLVVSYCDVQGGKASVYVSDGSILDWQSNNIAIDPCFAEAGHWIIDPCVPTYLNNHLWIDADSDYHLKSEGWRWDINTDQWTWDNVTSRCIDAGNPGCGPVDEPLPNSRNRINMGAYGGTSQASIPPHNWGLLADLNNDGIVNFTDYAEPSIDWTSNSDCQPGDLSRNGTIDIDDLALFIDDWLKETIWY